MPDWDGVERRKTENADERRLFSRALSVHRRATEMHAKELADQERERKAQEDADAAERKKKNSLINW